MIFVSVFFFGVIFFFLNREQVRSSLIRTGECNGEYRMSKGGREEDTKKLNASSLGWSTGSSVQPRKRKEISGM